MDEQCEKRLPSAIVIGIQKAGTTTLLTFLGNHPRIAVASGGMSERQYFCKHYDKPLEFYRQMMPCSNSNQITIEKSPPYFYDKNVPERIRKMNPNTKIIIIVKEPIERAISQYAMWMSMEDERVRGKSFEDMVVLNNRTMVVNRQTQCVCYSVYAYYMKRWLDTFNRNQILILDGHNFVKDPSYELTAVEKFLQIEHYFTPDRFMFNKTKQMYTVLYIGLWSPIMYETQ